MPSNPVEELKARSQQLRGTISQALADASKDHFSEEDNLLLKFHGSYQQDNRDLRVERKRAGMDKAWSMMLRIKMPSGRLTCDQYLEMDRLAGELANGTLRVTTRQAVQFHGVLKSDFKEAMQRIHRSGLTTWGACGDVVRNTMGPASPIEDAAHRDVQSLAQELNETFLARTRAYVEIWLDGEKVADSGGETEVPEPIYGKLYLPRKFKIGLAIPPRNDTDIFTQDLGYVAHLDGEGKVEGYTVLVGGGFGMSHGHQQTFPVLGKPLFFVRPAQAVEAAVAIVTTQRDHGNREDRKQSRMKYLIEKKGIEWFRQEVASRMQGPWEPARPISFETVGDELGWHEQGDGRSFVCLWIPEGRIKDIEGGAQFRSGLRQIVSRYRLSVCLTPGCNVILHGIAPSDRPAIEVALRECGIDAGEGLTEARRTSHACVSLPTCGLALAESERYFPQAMAQIDAVLRELGLAQEPLLVRMSGCPNGCSRPYNADFAFVGRAPNKYAMYVGGSIRGDRLAGLWKKSVEGQAIGQEVRPLLEEFAAQRHPNELFSDWWARCKVNGEAPSSDQFHIELAERAARLAAT